MVALTYNTSRCKIASQQEAAVEHRELGSVLCALEGWDGVRQRREAQEGGDIRLLMLIHVVV